MYIVVAKQGVERMLKTGEFTLEPGEHAFRLDIEVDDQVFEPASLPMVRIFVPKESMSREVQVETAVRVETLPRERRD